LPRRIPEPPVTVESRSAAGNSDPAQPQAAGSSSQSPIMVDSPDNPPPSSSSETTSAPSVSKEIQSNSAQANPDQADPGGKPNKKQKTPKNPKTDKDKHNDKDDKRKKPEARPRVIDVRPKNFVCPWCHERFVNGQGHRCKCKPAELRTGQGVAVPVSARENYQVGRVWSLSPLSQVKYEDIFCSPKTITDVPAKSAIALWAGNVRKVSPFLKKEPILSF